MASLPNTKLVTYEEWLEMPEREDEEVVDGEIRVMATAKWNHAVIVANLQAGFFAQLDHSKHLVITGSYGLVIRTVPLTCRTPDLAILEHATFVEVDGYLRSAPSLAVEVLSPRNTPRDMRQKIADYVSLGLPELWILSQDERTVEVLLFEEGGLRRSAIVAEGSLRPSLISQSTLLLFGLSDAGVCCVGSLLCGERRARTGTQNLHLFPRCGASHNRCPPGGRGSRDKIGFSGMASLPNTKLVTYEEWLEMPEVSDAIEEVINGEIQIMPLRNGSIRRSLTVCVMRLGLR